MYYIMSLKKKKNKKKNKQKGSCLLEDISSEEMIMYKKIYSDLIAYDTNVDLKNIQKTENLLLSIHLRKKTNQSILGLLKSGESTRLNKQYINSLDQKFIGLIVPYAKIKVPIPKSSMFEKQEYKINTVYRVKPFTDYYTVDNLKDISLSKSLYRVTDNEYNIVNINEKILNLCNQYTKKFYSND